MPQRFPDFLIIGAMKAGTTTLFEDLLTQPSVFMPESKEPESLRRDQALTQRGRKAYAALFRKSRDEQICGEASTGYTKLPDFPDVPRRALEMCGPSLKLIYLVREPIARMRSHHHHWLTADRSTNPDIDQAARIYPQLVDWSRYAMQARAWIDVFGRDALRIVRFETFIKERRTTIAGLCDFLGIECDTSLIDESAVFNPSEGKTIVTGRRAIIRRNRFYQKLIKPLVSPETRTRLKGLIGTKAPPRPDPPSRATVEHVVNSLRDDLEDLRGLMGLDRPVWDMDEVIAKHT
jgi:hypothetical protein